MDHRLECGMGFASRAGNTLELFEFAQVGLDAEVALLGFKGCARRGCCEMQVKARPSFIAVMIQVPSRTLSVAR